MLLTLFPLEVFSAQVLQVNSENSLTIGDNNRTYKVKIACLYIDPLKEAEAFSWLKSSLPRNSRVNLSPRGFENGFMLAGLLDVRAGMDIAKSMELNGFGKIDC